MQSRSWLLTITGPFIGTTSLLWDTSDGSSASVQEPPKVLPHGRVPAECCFWQHVGDKDDERCTNWEASQLADGP